MKSSVTLLLILVCLPLVRPLWDKEFVGLHIPEFSCVGCTLVIGVVEGYASSHNASISDSLDFLCSILPSPAKVVCDKIIADVGPIIIEMLENRETPDAVCRELQQCVNASAQCSLFPPPTLATARPVGWYREQHARRKSRGFDPFQWLYNILSNIVNSHKPWIDLDFDTFGVTEELRGWSWRGLDCNDTDYSVYPGRRVNSRSAGVDYNCNGIYGTDSNGTDWEDLLCTVPQYGFVVVGDSAAAHFHIPVQYLNGSMIANGTFDNILDIIANEVDWPQMSTYTGFMAPDWQGVPEGPLQSLYLLVRQQNLCSHRDYQNIAVNGARAGAMKPPNGIINSFIRRPTLDQPVLVTYALIGNDVCNGHHTTDNYTPPDVYKAEVLASLDYLNATLPSGSHLTFVGLVDGRVLWDIMSALPHPISANRGDVVTYAAVYDYLNCLGISPCYGWLNTNESIRNFTSAWAASLNAVYEGIIANYTFANFDMNYLDFPIAAIQEMWVDKGGKASDLIEPVDGFHPSQLTHALMADYIWQWYNQSYPQYIPPLNPNNALIAKLFGDQGGYGPV